MAQMEIIYVVGGDLIPDDTPETGLIRVTGTALGEVHVHDMGMATVVGTDGGAELTKAVAVGGNDGSNFNILGVAADGSIDANLVVGDIEIGAVELKNASTDERASIEAANTARTTATKVLATQNVDAFGEVMAAADLVSVRDTNIERYLEIDEVEGSDIGNWVAGTDVANIALSTEHIPHEGKADCIEMDKTGGTQTTAIMSKTIAVDGSAFEGPTLLEMAVKHGNYTNVASIICRLGTDGSNYHEYAIDPVDFATGEWVRIEFNVWAGLQTGTGLDMSTITYIALGVVMDAAANTIADVQFEEVRFLSAPAVSSAPVAITNDIGAVTRVTKVGSAAGPVWPKDSGNKDAGTPRVVIATDDVNQSAIKTAVEKIPALGTAVMAGAAPVTLATDDTMMVALDASVDIVAGDTTSMDAKMAALGTAAMAASSPVTLATDDTQYGAVGAAADVDGNIHGQLRTIGEAAEGHGLAYPVIDSVFNVALTGPADTANTALVADPGSDKRICVMGWYGTADTDAGTIAFQDEDDTVITAAMAVLLGGQYGAVSNDVRFPAMVVVANKALEIDTVTAGFDGRIYGYIEDVS